MVTNPAARYDGRKRARSHQRLDVRVGIAGILLTIGLAVATFGIARNAFAQGEATPVAATPDLALADASVRYLDDLGILEFELEVDGEAGGTLPEARGQLDGAPVLGYVVPTSLQPEMVGFTADEGIVALAATAHPDFDDTPLWDENLDHVYDNDGYLWHSHWVLVVPDERVPGGLAVKEVAAGTDPLPPTSPDLPLYLDSPGFPVRLSDNRLAVSVPVPRVYGATEFQFDAASVYLEISTADDRPMLGVYDVYGILSGDLSLPFEVTSE